MCRRTRSFGSDKSNHTSKAPGCSSHSQAQRNNFVPLSAPGEFMKSQRVFPGSEGPLLPLTRECTIWKWSKRRTEIEGEKVRTLKIVVSKGPIKSMLHRSKGERCSSLKKGETGGKIAVKRDDSMFKVEGQAIPDEASVESHQYALSCIRALKADAR